MRDGGLLFVCLGNICRSPTAEAIARKRLQDAGETLPLASAGTGDWHVGGQADKRARATAHKHGYDLEPHRARQVEVADFTRFDMILAMDRDNLTQLQALQPADSSARVGLLLEEAGLGAGREVPDPYFGGIEGFDACLGLLEQAVDGLLARLT